MFDLKQFRIDNNLKQSDLREILSCTQPTISQIENGRIPMPANFLKRLKDKYPNEDFSLYEKDSKGNDEMIQLFSIIESQQRTIENLSETIKLLSNK